MTDCTIARKECFLSKVPIRLCSKQVFILMLVALTLGLGISIPATTIKLVGTKADIRKGRKTGSPVSEWMVESTAAMALSYQTP